MSKFSNESGYEKVEQIEAMMTGLDDNFKQMNKFIASLITNIVNGGKEVQEGLRLKETRDAYYNFEQSFQELLDDMESLRRMIIPEDVT